MPSIALTLNPQLSRNWAAIWRYIKPGPRHLLMYVFGRFGVVRSIVVRAARRAPAALPADPATSLLDDVSLDRVARNLVDDGIAPGLQLRPQVRQEIHNYASKAICFGADESKFPFVVTDRQLAQQRYGRQLTVGHLKNPIADCPTIAALAIDPTILSIARKYLGVEPVLLGARVWWSFASEIDCKQQMSLGQGFHYDLDGYRALAFFFYLTDVKEVNGPHVCVRGSHKQKPLKSLLSLAKGREDAEINSWYEPSRQITVCGKAGSGFAEDIFCYHKGTHPTAGERLILQLRYGLRKYGHD